MANKHSLSDFLHYTNRKTYSDNRGQIDYLDGAPLSRPLKMPMAQRTLVVVIVAIAAVLGIIFINNTVLASLREAAAAEQAIADNLARTASIDTIPNLTSLVTKNDVGIRETFDDAGYTYYDASSTSDSGDMILYKLPDDVTLEEAAALYAQGISNLSATQATKLLNGSWQFVSEHSGIESIVVRYADFSTGDPQIAVQNALQKTGFSPDSVTDSGKDESGNTYSSGTFEADDSTYAWKISAIALDEMYSISNMPEEACYVGIRATKQ